MKMVGHKTEAVYRRYAIVSESDLHEAARKLAALPPAGTFSARRPLSSSRSDLQPCDNPHTREWRNWQTRWT
jgi:hypothetical protein